MKVALSDYLVEDILEWLPTKSLMRFKNVKRSWNSLFKTMTFVKRHSQRLKERVITERFLTLFIPFDSSSMFDKISILLLSSNHLNPLELPKPEYDTISSFLHYNGVICLHYSRDFVLWNPATREVKLIPTSPIEQILRSNPLVHFDYQYGFGFDPNTYYDFKIVQMLSMFLPNGDENNLIKRNFVMVYDTRKNSWTIGPGDNYFNHLIINNHHFYYYAFANGFFHWLSFDYTFILCFDFHSHQCHKLNTPSTLPGSIFEVNDSVAYVAPKTIPDEENVLPTVYDIWILKQDSSWTKMYKVGPFYTNVKIEAIWNDGTEFLSGCNHNELISYNSNGQPMRKFRIPLEGFFFRMQKYVESITPL